jgi:MFS transporter, putative metabolite:H+ symporter
MRDDLITASAVSEAAAGAKIGVANPDGAEILIARFEAIPFSPWHRRARIVMGGATFLDAFDALSLAFVLPILAKLWSLSAADIGWLIAASYVGQTIGALVFSHFAERLGRISMAATATAIMSVMSLGCALVGNFHVLLLCRLIQGVGIGGEMPVAAAYISELLKAKGRGRHFMLYEMIFPVGLMITGQVGTVLVPMLGWKSLFIIGGAPGLIVAYLLLRLPESPRWLIGRGRFDEAENIIEKAEASANLEYPGHADSAARHPIAGTEQRAIAVSRRTRWGELLASTYRPRTLIVWVLWASAFFVANSLNNWMPTLYHTMYRLDLSSSLRAASMNNVAQVAILLICAFCIDRIGRRVWAIVCYTVGALMLAALAAGGAGHLWMVFVLAALSYGIVGSINAVLYLYTPEIYPTRMRAIGTGLATSWLRIASAVGPMMVGYLVAGRGIRAVFAMFAIVAALGAVAATGMIETGGRKLEEIAA